MRDLKDIYWLAGLVEGEGSFYLANQRSRGVVYKRSQFSLTMTDIEPIEKAAKLIGNVTIHKSTLQSGKTAYRIQLTGKRCAEWAQTLFLLLSPRRQEQIKICLNNYKNLPGSVGKGSRRTKEQMKQERLRYA